MTVSEIISASADTAVAISAVAALLLAWRQIGVSREISALEAYEDYHKLAIEYPEFCNGPDPKTLSNSDQSRYIYFVLYVLMVAERIYVMVPKHKSWIMAIEEDIRIHKNLISSETFSTYLAQEWAIGHLIAKVLAEN